MWSSAEFVEQRVARAGTLHQRGIVDVERHAIVHQAHLLIAGEEDEGAASGVAQDAGDLFGCRAGEGGRTRIGQMLGHVEQRLLGIFEMAMDDQRSGVANAQAALGEFECFPYGERSGGKDHGVQLVE